MTAAVPPDANGLRGVEAMARAMYETGLLNLPLSDSLDIDCHDAARAALAVLAASEAAPTAGERECDCQPAPFTDHRSYCSALTPATPPADDASAS